jgi:Ca2+-binding RTX toxin-like protein
MKCARIVVVALLAALAAAAPASAGQVSVNAGVLTFSGAELDVEATPSGSDYSIFDYTGALEGGDGCTLDNPEPPLIGPLNDRTFTCAGPIASVLAQPSGEYSSIYVSGDVPKRLEGGPGGDYFYGSGAGPVTALGGAGDDSLAGGSADDLLDAGAGDDDMRGSGGADHLIGGSGNDFLDGDPYEGTFEEDPGQAPPATGSPDVLEGGGGNDQLFGGFGADRLIGGPGRDTATYERSTDLTLSIGAAGGEDELDVENVRTYKGADVVHGDGRPNDIQTSEGNDTVDPGAGTDNVDTGKGDDTVLVRDGEVDDVTCGEGADHVVADTTDAIDESCETVERADAPAASGPAAPGAGPAGGAIAPSGLVITVRRRGRTATLRGVLQLPAGAATSLCDGGGVSLSIKGSGRRGVTLDGRCRFTLKLRTKARRLQVQARFAGTPSLAPFDSGRRSLR